MAAKKLTTITMASALFLLLLLVPASGARYLSGQAIETQHGIVAIDGISPVPTEAPGLNGIPKELLVRAPAQTFIETPPSSWCGFIDGNYQSVVACDQDIPCVQKSNFYGICCANLNTASCLASQVPTLCIDSTVWAKNTDIGIFTVACYNPIRPYCVTLTSGSSRTFGCTSTSSPSIKSFVPVSVYYAALPKTLTTSQILSANTTGTTSASATKISSSTTTISTPTTTSFIPFSTKISTQTPSPTQTPPPKLSTAAVAGIGIGAGLVVAGAIAAIVFIIWRKRSRDRASSTDQAVVHQQYQAQPDMTKIPQPGPGDIPPYSPAPGYYTSGGQQMSNAPITSYDPNSASKHPASTITTALPLAPNPSSYQTNQQQQQNSGTSWDYPPPHSPNSVLGVGPEGGSNMQNHHPEFPPSPSELGPSEAGLLHHHTGGGTPPWNNPAELGPGTQPQQQQQQQQQQHHSGSPVARAGGNHPELSGTGIAGGAHHHHHS